MTAFRSLLNLALAISQRISQQGISAFCRRILRTCAYIGLVGIAWNGDATTAAETANAIDKRLSDTVRYLSSDDLEGRGVGTKGLDEAAEFIARQFAEIGLEPNGVTKEPFQCFTMTMEAKLGAADQNSLAFVPQAPGDNAAGNKITANTNTPPVLWKLGDDFTPLAAGGSGEFDLPLAFVGYGITDDKSGYDDYDNVDVNGKCVIVLRHQPLRGDTRSPFDQDPSRHAYFQTKIANARRHGAAAILFCTGHYELDKQIADLDSRGQGTVKEIAEVGAKFAAVEQPSAEQLEKHRKAIDALANRLQKIREDIKKKRDPVLAFHRAGAGGSASKLPMFHCRRAVLDHALSAALGKDLAALEDEIDKSGKPNSRIIEGWHAAGKTVIERSLADVRNVIGVLNGKGPLADETIVIGAHYDHIGYGGRGSAAPKSREVHNGADDNGSGVAALLEVARRLKTLDAMLARRIVFIAFAGEERGLLGSEHYVKNPIYPIKSTVAMINMDMVGRLKDNKLMVNGTGTADGFDLLIQRLNAQHDFKVTSRSSGYGPSDHQTFYQKKIPVLHFFTGLHQDYHRPSDDFEKVNIPGIRRISSMVADTASMLADAETRPQYLATERKGRPGGRRPFFGSLPDGNYQQPGARIAGVTPDGPAEAGGVKTGDVIVRIGKMEITNVADLVKSIGRHKAGDKVEVVLRRDGRQQTLTVTLGPPRN